MPERPGHNNWTTATGRSSGLRIVLLAAPSHLWSAVSPETVIRRAMAFLRRSSPITAAAPRWIRTTFPKPATASHLIVEPPALARVARKADRPTASLLPPRRFVKGRNRQIRTQWRGLTCLSNPLEAPPRAASSHPGRSNPPAGRRRASSPEPHASRRPRRMHTATAVFGKTVSHAAGSAAKAPSPLHGYRLDSCRPAPHSGPGAVRHSEGAERPKNPAGALRGLCACKDLRKSDAGFFGPQGGLRMTRRTLRAPGATMLGCGPRPRWGAGNERDSRTDSGTGR